jgi:DNA-binding SARP family transcriptional activator/regulation of enolase protein 1 (concanavalin A-like superfamily)
MDAYWRVQLMGGLRALGDSRELTRFRTQKTGVLLAYLAYYRRRSHPREALIDLLWPEADPGAASNSLSQALSSLRHQLEPPGVPTGAVLVANRASVRLNPEAVTTDTEEFEAALHAAASAGSHPERMRWLAQAVDLYRGELLAGYYENWVLEQREWLAESYFQALSQLLALLEQAGDLPHALEYARQGVLADPLREEARRDLMRLYAAVGQPGAALRQYGELERLLEQELATAPAAATCALAEEIRRLSRSRPSISTAPESLTPAPEAAAPSSREPHPAWPEGANRVVTVLVADTGPPAATSPALIPEEEADLLRRLLEAMGAVLQIYEGRVDRFLAGGVVAVFGTPQAHEDDPERAIRAALEIREAAQALGPSVTAGINTGSVFVGDIGVAPPAEAQVRSPGVVGPVVHLATALQAHATAGQILVGQATYRLTRRAFAFSPLGLAIAGSARPVIAYAVADALPRPQKAYGIEGLRAELIGRDEELARLQAALAKVLAGEGQMVTLVGEAGVGKSRLVAELKEAARGSSSPLWLEGRALELGMSAGYWLFVDLFRDFLAWRPEEDDPARGRRLAAALRDLAARGHLAEERVEEMGPLLGNLLSLRFGNDWDDRLKYASPEQVRHQTFLAVRDFFAALARQQPIVLVLEDLHWADSLSPDLISLLMEAVPRVPLLLLCIYRPEREHRCRHLPAVAGRKCPERYTEIHLSALTPAESRRLVSSLLPGDRLPASVPQSILDKAHGNPFFLEEVVRSLIDAGTLYREGGSWQAREGIGALAVPESVQSIILSRVDRLERDARRVLETAAVIGRLFRRRWLERSIFTETAPESALRELEDRGLIYPERLVPETEYSFQHVLIQEAIYQSLSRRHRAALHQQVAEAIEALHPAGLDAYYEQLAYHYERSAADEKAVEYLLKAGEKARRIYLCREAIGYFARALDRLGHCAPADAHSQRRLEALKGLGLSHFDLGDLAEAEARLRQAIALGREIRLAPRELARLHWWLADILSWRTRGVRSAEMGRLAQEGLALLGDDTESTEAALMNMHAGGRLLENIRFLERVPYSEELRSVYSNIIAVYAFRKNVAEATRWLEALQRRAEQHHDTRARATVRFDRAQKLLAPSGDLRGAISQLLGALELLAGIGDTKHGTQCERFIGYASLQLGDLQQAAEYGHRSVETARAIGSRRDLGWSLMRIGTIRLCQSAWQEALEAFGEATQIFREIEAPGWAAEPALYLGRTYLALGKRREAWRQLEETAALVSSDFRGCVGELAGALSGLEETADDPEAFLAFCRRYRVEHPGVGDLSLKQWFLEATEPFPISLPKVHEDFAGPLSADWAWHDPFGDCSFTAQDGLAIEAANGRDLWGLNQSAPRLLRPASGDFVVETVCFSAAHETPAVGGLLLWRDRQNYLRLDRGTRGRSEISFSGCLENADLLLGRGRLPAERVHLRLERFGNRVKALCSADGHRWLAVGGVAFPADGPVEVGLHVLGNIDRTIYPGAYPQGTAIRFASFDLWGTARAALSRRRRSAR